MAAISQDARVLFQANQRGAAGLSLRSAVVLWLASSGLLWTGIIQALRALV
jgi:hypothetical protein